MFRRMEIACTAETENGATVRFEAEAVDVPRGEGFAEKVAAAIAKASKDVFENPDTLGRAEELQERVSELTNKAAELQAALVEQASAHEKQRAAMDELHAKVKHEAVAANDAANERVEALDARAAELDARAADLEKSRRELDARKGEEIGTLESKLKAANETIERMKAASGEEPPKPKPKRKPKPKKDDS